MVSENPPLYLQEQQDQFRRLRGSTESLERAELKHILFSVVALLVRQGSLSKDW